MQITESSAVQRAKQVLAGLAASPLEARDLVKKLKVERQFGWARKALTTLWTRERFQQDLAADPDSRLILVQARALTTYKDADLATDKKYSDALMILQVDAGLSLSRNQETLGLAGAIYKRMWEHRGGTRQLEIALHYYLRGHREGVQGDGGYTSINAAFVLDLLADVESPDDGIASLPGNAAEQRRRQAADIRRSIVETLEVMASGPKGEELRKAWWFLVTIAEACFGLDEYKRADTWLRLAKAVQPRIDWEYESTARQLASLMGMKLRAARQTGKTVAPEARATLHEFLEEADSALESVVRGKVGLALSGGGFRASLYHIGVMAKLAEFDLLRHVEFLSCVSGGSIVGAHYYLELRRLLQSKPDHAVTRADYIHIVELVAEHFLLGVQRNIRTRVAAEWTTNLRMIFTGDYSRTKRAGELYETEIYARVEDGEGKKPRWLQELKIIPASSKPDAEQAQAGEGKHFRPKDHNWKRSAKVPILILNATSLNTGHNWQFTATWMGEPPAGIDSEVDASYRLRRMYYSEAPRAHQRMRLGYAVAASACVPGLFEPLSLANLYEPIATKSGRSVRPIVRLVDGGVNDNQGTAALLEQGCSVVLVSDASGQINNQDTPSNGMLGVPLRAGSVLQARVRISQYEDLESRRRGGLLKGLLFVHIKRDLETRPVDWLTCQDPSPQPTTKPLTSYGIQRDIQEKLASVRTDLDSFTDVEAYALMTSGYAMTEHALKKPVLGFEVDQTLAPHAWRFLAVRAAMTDGTSAESQALRRQLDVSDQLAFKAWRLIRGLQVLAGVLALGALVGLGVWITRSWNAVFLSLETSVGEVVLAAGLTALSLVGVAWLTKVIRYRKTLEQVLIGLGMAVFGFLLARLHLHVFDRWFLKQGRVA